MRNYTIDNEEVVVNGVKSYLAAIRRMRGKGAEDFHYSGLEDLLLQEGNRMQTGPLTIDENQFMIDSFSSFMFNVEVKQCYANCQQALTSIRSTDKFIVKYVEGYALKRDIGIPLQHAWLTVNDKVMDITWNRETFGVSERSNTIYYGVEINRRDIMESALSTGMWQCHLDNYWAGWQLYKNKFENNKPYYEAKQTDSKHRRQDQC